MHVSYMFPHVAHSGLGSTPAIFFDHVNKFDDEFAFFVLLTAFESLFLKQQTVIATMNEIVMYGSLNILQFTNMII